MLPFTPKFLGQARLAGSTLGYVDVSGPPDAFYTEPDLSLLTKIYNISLDLHDLRSDDASAFREYAVFKALAKQARVTGVSPEAGYDTAASASAGYENWAATYMAKVQSLDRQIMEEIGLAEALIQQLSTADLQKKAHDTLITYQLTGFHPATAMSGRKLGQAAGVECLPTSEGGKVCSDGTYFPPGGGPVVKATDKHLESPPISTTALVVGGLALAAAGAAIYFSTR